ncbi:MAG: hypothetical protein K2M75_06820 [Clostridia bacterium]|nr:hypothetical protein [Clostridia bacterium]
MLNSNHRVKALNKIILIFLAAAILCCIPTSAVACSKVEMSYDATTKYGIYWFGDDNYDYVRSGSDMDVKYFDPAKPTFVFAHGWEPDKNNSTDGLFEDFVTHKETVSNTGTSDVRDYAKILKEQGYNVACLSWFSYAKDLSNLFKYIWLTFDGGDALSVRMAMELALTLGEDYNGDVKIVGHSYGSQLALATTYQLVKQQEKKAFKNNHIIPTRMTLADPYFGSIALISGWDSIKNDKISFTNEPLKERKPSVLFADITDYVVGKKDIAVDMYFGMGIASTSYYKYDGSDKSFEKLSKKVTVVKSEGLKKEYGDFSIHNIVRDWVLLSIVDGVIMRDQNDAIAPSGSATDAQIKAMRGKCYQQTYQGFDLSKDSMKYVDRGKEQF